MFGGKRQPARATIVADEGYGLSRGNANESMHHQKYIVDVQPDNGEAAFRTEVKVWVPWPEYPQPGDVVSAVYRSGSNDVEIVLDGDPRFDRKLRREGADTHPAAAREDLLHQPPGTPPPDSTG